MHELVRKTLEIYLNEKQLITLSQIPSSVRKYEVEKNAIFVTLYHKGAIIASSGRIQCKKDNSIYECIDNTLLCLKDIRFTLSLQSPAELPEIDVRVDTIPATGRRILQKIEDLDIKKEGLIFLSQNYGVMSVLLPGMSNLATTPLEYLEISVRKAGLKLASLVPSDYVIYGITTERSTSF